MKKILCFLFAVSILSGCGDDYDDSALTGRVDDLENRITKLEELCKQMNTNISSLQALVNALQDNDYITGVTPITKDGETIGYTISFAKSAPITIYHGEDGKDGQDGKPGEDGNDGSTPIIGVKQATRFRQKVATVQMASQARMATMDRTASQAKTGTTVRTGNPVKMEKMGLLLS